MGKDLNRHSTKENIQMVDKHMESHSILLVIREMQIETIMIYDFMPTRMAIIKIFKKKNKCWQRCGATRMLIYNSEMLQSLGKQ